MTPKPVKPCRAYAIVNAKGLICRVSDLTITPLPGQRLVPGRFVPDAPKARKGTR